MIKNFTIAVILLTLLNPLSAQKVKTDANIVGRITSDGEHIPFATVAIKGTTVGTATDETGHYQLVNLPTGVHEVVVSVIGYKTKSETVSVQNGETVEIKFDLTPDLLNLDEVVVSADRGAQKRTDAPVIINTISPELFSTSESVTLGEGLNFSPGLRLENNCQNCGFTQIRMNGMDGAHSQILINSRPIFSGLAGVYGLELLPTSMIEKVEIVRGGGSALFGSNAVAGTINIILKDPKTNSYELGGSYTSVGVGVDSTGGVAPDFTLNASASVVSDDRTTGLSLYGFTRKREMFDANSDGFSEIAPMSNVTFGTRFFHKFSTKDKLTLDFFTIKEQRDGGSDQEKMHHERRISESLVHNMFVGGLSYEHYFRKYDLLTIYGSGQYLNRDSYYGANYSLSDYGNTTDNTYNLGMHYKMVFDESSLILGVDNTTGYLKDTKLGYTEYAAIGDSLVETRYGNTIVTDQASITTGVFAQYDMSWNKFKLALGARYDLYEIIDYQSEGTGDKTGNVLSPRVSVMYEIFKELKTRFSYSQGYRAPQIFDEDLHILSSGSRQIIHVNDPDLRQETSHSYMASIDYNGLIGSVYTGFLVEGFHTRLVDAFANEIGEPNEDGTVVYTRTNAAGATVQGLNFEFKLKPLKNFSLTSGYTIQTSLYDNPQDFGEKNFFRTPNKYGFVALDWDFIPNLCFSTTATYTGSMLVPYFGLNTDPDVGELRTSDPFFDMGVKLEYDIKINGSTMKIYGGIKNILNSYQSDFDKGIDRDPAYVYGPNLPRTVYFGIKIGNIF